MNFLRTIGNVRDFYLYRGQEVFVFDDKLHVGSQILDSPPEFSYFVQNDNLERLVYDCDDKPKYFLYQDGQFVAQTCRYGNKFTLLGSAQRLSRKYEDGRIMISLIDGTQEFLFEIKSDSYLRISKMISRLSILILPIGDEKSLLFYSKTGERLWEYREEEANLVINCGCIPVVDDVVVVISMLGLRPEKMQGFNVRTGERLWGATFDGKGVSNTLFVGDDGVLYGCMTPFASRGLVLTILNPFTGELVKHVISEEDGFDVMPWLVTMHGQRLYYTDNRRGNEIGVIDVDRRELVECVPLNIKKKVTIGAPVVSDDKVYVFISDLRELRVFEK